VICFSSGDYNYSNDQGLDLYGVSPSSRVTLQPAPGATVELGTLNYNGVSNVTVTGFEGASVSGGVEMVPAGMGNNVNDQVLYTSMPTNGVRVQNPIANSNTLIAEDQFVGYASSGEGNRITVVQMSGTGPCSDGVTIANNLISGGESDGVDVAGNVCGTQIVNNVVTNIQEANCNGIHCDAFQDNGASNNTVIKGNYISNVSDCGLFDNDSYNITYSDNVCTNVSGFAFQFGGAVGLTMDHNTFATTTPAQIGNGADGTPTSGLVMTNNVFQNSISVNPGQPITLGSGGENYNLWKSGKGLSNGPAAGANDMTATPTFAGGASPSTFAGFGLSSSSPGFTGGAGASILGINDTSVVPGP
jgi:hypothetical protein